MNAEDLINQVKEFPALYNKNDARYKNKLAKENAWMTIASILDHDVPVVTCEQRWISLRGKYTTIRKKIREMPSGSGSADISCYWPYYTKLSFLDPFLLTRKTVSNFKEQPSVQPVSSAWDTITQVLEEASSAEHSESDYLSSLVSPAGESVEAPSPSPSAHQLRVQKTSSPTPQVHLGSHLGAKKRKNPQDELCSKMSSFIDTLTSNMGQKCAEREFGLSLAKDMEALTPEEKMFFKKNVCVG